MSYLLLKTTISNFLQRIDRQLLLHAPLLWESRVHLLAFWGGLYIGLVWLLSAFLPFNLLASLKDGWEKYLYLSSAVIWIWWIRAQNRQNLLEDAGRDGKRIYLRMLVYMGSVLLLLLPAFSAPKIVQLRAMLIQDEVFEQDALALSQADPFFSTSNKTSIYEYLECIARNENASVCKDSYDFTVFDYYIKNQSYAQHELASAHGLPPADFYGSDKHQNIVLPAIERYLSTMEKYGQPIDMSAVQVFKAHLGKEVLALQVWRKKQAVVNILRYIRKAKEKDLIQGRWFHQFTLWLCVVCSLASFGSMWKMVPWKAWVMFLYMAVGLSGMMFGLRLGAVSKPLLLLLLGGAFGGLFYAISKNKGPNTVRFLMLVVFNAAAPYAFWFLLLAFGRYARLSFASEHYWYIESISVLLSLGIYGIWILPWVHRKFLLQIARPEP